MKKFIAFLFILGISISASAQQKVILLNQKIMFNGHLAPMSFIPDGQGNYFLGLDGQKFIGNRNQLISLEKVTEPINTYAMCIAVRLDKDHVNIIGFFRTNKNSWIYIPDFSAIVVAKKTDNSPFIEGPEGQTVSTNKVDEKNK